MRVGVKFSKSRNLVDSAVGRDRLSTTIVVVFVRSVFRPYARQIKLEDRPARTSRRCPQPPPMRFDN
jgi:hypothetical protein